MITGQNLQLLTELSTCAQHWGAYGNFQCVGGGPQVWVLRAHQGYCSEGRERSSWEPLLEKASGARTSSPGVERC